MRDIAIVGMGCRFPGAADLDGYWRLLRTAERQFRPVPRERWEHSRYLVRGDRTQGKSYTDRVAFLDDVERFDAAHYRIPPRRAQLMDPQHRLLLDVSREAVQDAGWERRGYDRATTGVYFALSTAEFIQRTPGPASIQPYSVPGLLLNMAAATVSQYYDLGGPSFTVDSACSSGLTALSEAVTALRAGICSEALVGGAYLNLVPVTMVGFSQVGAVSAAGVCRPFDRRADGFVLGEGIGVVVLRPLAAALAAGDRVYAVIRGIGCANDGTSDGPMTPREEGQCRALRRAYSDAGLPATSVGLIEAHGTATIIGDRVELDSLRRVRGEVVAAESDAPAERCYLTSVKSLIGHSLTASGLASLIKTALALYHREIPPQPPTEVGHELAGAGLELPTAPTPWPAGGTPRRAGINSFGFGGTNVHVVLEEAPAVVPATDQGCPQLLLFSAGTADGLRGYAERVAALSEQDATVTLVGLAATLATRQPLRHRLAVVASDLADLRAKLRTALPALAGGRAGRLADGVFAGPAPSSAPPVALVFGGQGGQRPGMLRDLYERYPTFRAHADRLDGAVLDAQGFSALGAVYDETAPTDAAARLTRTDVCQPVLGVLELAASRLVAECGVLPAVTLGHSVGEFPAASVAGALDDTDTVLMMAERGALMRAAEAGGRGGMLAVQLPVERVEPMATGLAGIWHACLNHPKQTVLAGTPAALDEFASRCAAEGVAHHRLDVSNAFHTPLLDGVREQVAEALTRYRLRAPQAAFVSSVDGERCTDPVRLRHLWSRHAVAPVRFSSAAVAAYEAGARIFVQVDGGGAVSAIRHSLAGHDDCHYVALADDGPDDGRTFLTALAQLAVLGIDVDPSVLTDPATPLLSLPASPLADRAYRLPPWPDVDRLLASGTVTEPDTAPPTGPPVPAAAADRQDGTVREIVALMRDQIALLRTVAPADVQIPAASGAPPEPAPDAVHPASTDRYDEVRATVYSEVARIGAFPADRFTGSELLVQDLGFDSLMITELMTALSRIWPALAEHSGALPKRPTLDQAVDTVTAILAGAASAPPVRRENGLADMAELQQHRTAVAELGDSPYFRTHEANVAATTRIAGRELISFSSYNYLGLSGHPLVNQEVFDAISRYGTSVSASRFLSGNRPLHDDLEAELSALLGTEGCLVTVSGHATNVSVIGHLVRPGDLVVHDELAHDSILQGCALSGATRRPFRHNDPAALDAVLGRHRAGHRRCLVVVEGVYSMDGDIADLPGLVEVKRRHGALLMVDEAHSLGTVGGHGGGVGEYFGLSRSAVELWSGTLSKSLASCGGYVAGDAALIDYLKYTTPGFVYSVGITPANAAAALGALKIMRAEPERLARLTENSRLFLEMARQAGANTGTSKDSPVIPCILATSNRCLELSRALFEKGISVDPIRYPAVPEELARLRFFITSEHTRTQLERAAAVLAEELQRSRDLVEALPGGTS